MLRYLFPLFLAGLITQTSSAQVFEMTVPANSQKSKGGTLVAAENEKGQTFTVAESGKVTGVIIHLGTAEKAADLSIEIVKTESNQPAGAPIATISGDLPEATDTGGLKVMFPEPVSLDAGSYALILRTEASSLKVNMSDSDRFKGGHMIRRNKSTKSKWTTGVKSGSDLVFQLLGDLKISNLAGAATPSPNTSIELKWHRNPEFTPKELSAIKTQPNIITIMVDDLGWNQIGVANPTLGTNPKMYQTPNLEKLTAGGLCFTHAYAQPNCAPTRAAMLTGQYPARIHNDVYVVNSLNRFSKNGLTAEKAKFKGPNQTQDVAAPATTVAEALKENGYSTAHIGKYHAGGHSGEETLPENSGFDINIGGFKQGHQPTCFASKSSDKYTFKGVGRGDLDRFAAPYTEAYLTKHNFPESLLGTQKHISDAVGDAMEETVAKLAGDTKPFYLQVHPYAVHGPVKSRPDLLKQQNNDHLVGFVRSVDIIVGRVIKATIDPNGDGDTSDSIADKTLILFTSDNGGTHRDNLPLRGHKGMFTEGGIRVPLIAYWPGTITANTTTDQLVHSVDYYPTYLKFAGEKWTPPKDDHPLDGVSFANTLLNPNQEENRGPIYYLFPGYLDTRAQPCAVAIDEINGSPHKLIYFYESNSWELYDINQDIGESKNLIAERPELAATLSKKLNAWLTQEHPTWQPKYPIAKGTDQPAGPPPLFTTK